MPSIILTALHTLQAAFSGYNLYLASISIQNLQGYEDASKKAAEYSNVAEKQLHKTRTTQASGTLAILCTFLSSTYLLTSPLLSSASGPSAVTKLLVAAVNLAALAGARSHVGAFWKGKKKIPLPGVGDYNEATGKTQEIRLNMMYLMASWAGVGVLGWL